MKSLLLETTPDHFAAWLEDAASPVPIPLDSNRFLLLWLAQSPGQGVFRLAASLQWEVGEDLMDNMPLPGLLVRTIAHAPGRLKVKIIPMTDLTREYLPEAISANLQAAELLAKRIRDAYPEAKPTSTAVEEAKADRPEEARRPLGFKPPKGRESPAP